MTMTRILVTGASGLATRLEINDFIKDTKFFTLFIQALLMMQRADEEDDNSFFSISGIHGQPYIPWNGATGSFVQGKWNFGGYCTHGSVLFPMWHRPYLALFEQTIQERAIDLATRFVVDQQSWRAAACSLRLPYWDWVTDSVPPDCVIRDATVTILDFDGTEIQVVNPLVRHRFQKKQFESFDVPFDRWSTTLRHPDSDGKEDIGELVQSLISSQSKLRDDTFALLSLVHDWDQFSNHSAHGSSITNSLEAIHDCVHVIIGGAGHMSEVSVAAFDPIFYLHHCNLDRLLSIWSAINEGKGVSAGKNDQGGTFTLAPQADLDENTELAPFWKSQDTFWCSRQIPNTQEFGYTYPEFSRINQNAANEERSRTWVTNYIENIFGSITTGAESARWWWTVRVRTKKFELGRSFSVLVFLGDVPADPNMWMTSENLVGAHYVFTNGAVERCPNCRNSSSAVTEGFVPLNRSISRIWPNSTSIDPTQIQGTLLNKLNWRVIDVSRQAVELKYLRVAVMSVPLVHGCKVPTIDAQKPTFFHDLTAGFSCTII